MADWHVFISLFLHIPSFSECCVLLSSSCHWLCCSPSLHIRSGVWETPQKQVFTCRSASFPSFLQKWFLSTWNLCPLAKPGASGMFLSVSTGSQELARHRTAKCFSPLDPSTLSGCPLQITGSDCMPSTSCWLAVNIMGRKRRIFLPSSLGLFPPLVLILK